MRDISALHDYQKFAIQHIMTHEASGLFLDMGLGKTVSTLTAVDRLLFDEMTVEKVLVIAPKKVTEHTWKEEISEWNHLKHLRLSIVLGTERQRKEALKAKADIYIINRENVAWLVSLYQSKFPFDMLVIDELSSFKNPSSVRFKALRTVRPGIKKVVGLTGTPAPNGLQDLWSQLYLLDQGERLGKTITGFRQEYFIPDQRNGPIVYNYKIKKETPDSLLGVDAYEKEILAKISDICISMKAEDYLDLPKRVDQINRIHLSPKISEQYLDFEKSLVLQIEDENEITALSAAALTNKLRQFANGAIYDADKNWYVIHNEKLDALEEDVEALNGQPVLIFYQYRHDLARILDRFKAYKPVLLKGSANINQWNQKKIPIMVTHAASAGHGLNLQKGGHHIEWFGLDWPSEAYQQGIKRIDRQGQLFPVINRRLLAEGTIDFKVLDSLSGKISKENAVMEAVKAIIKKHRS